MGFGSAAYSRTLQQVARYDASVAVTIGAHSSIGMRGLLLYGSEAQKQRYYAELASGKRIAAFCLTEPGSGSDAGSIRTTAERQGDHFVLNGEKLWITNGGMASFFQDNTRVPVDHVLGPLGGGFKVAMHILNNGRTGLGGGSVGAMKHVIALAAQHAQTRKQFGKPISEFGLIKQKLGRMMVDCFAAESVVNLSEGQIATSPL